MESATWLFTNGIEQGETFQLDGKTYSLKGANLPTNIKQAAKEYREAFSDLWGICAFEQEFKS